MSEDARLREEVREYYDTVSRYIEVELGRRHDREFWRRVLEETVPSAVLDLGCGTGRITEVLAEGVGPVLGIDLSRKMLRRARRRLEDRSHVHFIVADMRSLRLGRTFPLVVAANDPFTHMVEDEDRDRALETVARHVDPAGGRFILDAFWLGEDRLREAARPGGFRRERRLDPGGGSGASIPSGPLRIRETWRCELESRRCRVRFEYFSGDDGSGPRRDRDRGEVEESPVDRASFDARLWSVEELEDRLRRAGLRLDALEGGFDRRPFVPDKARHLIVHASRAAG